jgi:hypothetical protein
VSVWLVVLVVVEVEEVVEEEEEEEEEEEVDIERWSSACSEQTPCRQRGAAQHGGHQPAEQRLAQLRRAVRHGHRVQHQEVVGRRPPGAYTRPLFSST